MLPDIAMFILVFAEFYPAWVPGERTYIVGILFCISLGALMSATLRVCGKQVQVQSEREVSVRHILIMLLLPLILLGELIAGVYVFRFLTGQG